MAMKLKDLREWLTIVPLDFDECVLVFREIIPQDGSDELLAGDSVISAAAIDTSTNEACFYTQKSYDMVNDIDPDVDTAETLEPKDKSNEQTN